MKGLARLAVVAALVFAPAAARADMKALEEAAKNARHHYDVSSDVYKLFLDKKMLYSCAYFRDPEHETIEEAQNNKLVHATAKLGLKPGMKVAEIGSGWGAFAIHIAQSTGAHVTAINVSPEQLAVARERAKEDCRTASCRRRRVR